MMTFSSDWLTAPAAPADTLADAWTPAELPAGADPRTADHQTDHVADFEFERRSDARRAVIERQAEIEEAYQRGLEEGATQVLQRDAEAVRTALQALDKALAQVVAAERVWVETAKENIVGLAVATARHVIGRELKGDPHIVAELARRAITNFPVDEPVRVHVHPQDLSILTLATSEDGGNIPIAPGRQVTWVADSDIQQGGCVVEGRNRVIDGRVDHALERVYQKLTDD